MCETRSCPHEADALCTCRALLERDNDIIGLLTHIHENMTDVEWELDYTDLSRPEKRRLCLVGKCRICGGRLCQELDASDELAGEFPRRHLPAPLSSPQCRRALYAFLGI